MKNIKHILYIFIALTVFSHFAGAGEKKTIFLRSSEDVTIPLVTSKLNYLTDTVVLKKLEIESAQYKSISFTKILPAGIDLERSEGAPELPVKSYLLSGRPEEISVEVKVISGEEIKDLNPWPVQPQDCRCETQSKKEFTINKDAYIQSPNKYKLTYLGAFRGTPITRLDVRLAEYNSKENSVFVRTAIQVEANAKIYEMNKEDYKDYLFVMPEGASLDLAEFKTWKESRGYKINVIKFAPSEKNTTALSAKIKEAYLKLGIDFVILVGDENTIPMFYLSTSGSSRTPSDLQYFTMDGAGDNIPDVFYSRLASNDPGGQLQNAMDFEAGRGAPGGFNHVVGIASNEGSNPSDNEYITSIEQKFSTSLGSQASHFYQDSQDSNPVKLNDKLNDGAFWVTYMGHGSGFAWPSMNVSYMTKHIPLLKNKNSVKPVIIDVACQNGRLQSGRLGVAFSTLTPNGQSNAYGAAAYYGGTVDISWHPPAVMAQGIAFEQTDKKFKHLGEALMAGQLYLAAHWNDKKSFTDNLIWYHLQGDPGMDIGF